MSEGKNELSESVEMIPLISIPISENFDEQKRVSWLEKVRRESGVKVFCYINTFKGGPVTLEIGTPAGTSDDDIEKARVSVEANKSDLS